MDDMHQGFANIAGIAKKQDQTDSGNGKTTGKTKLPTGLAIFRTPTALACLPAGPAK
ncbi:MAG: hypothetical protein RQ753_00135 [Desulfurivibrionaceae bacterium]|nr:hypothetical protein [Desulfobulbales bacterium]MDT8334083.1 hypothetical protein [Desulfurivibrionaceae bacterium]